MAKDNEYNQEGRYMEDYIKQEGNLLETEKMLGHRQVAGAGNRKKLGYPLEEAEKD
jgi:hypothetical protein